MSDPVATPITAEQSEASKPPVFENKTKDITQTPTEVEPPYSEYESKKGKPFSVDYFELGDYWNEGELYNAEVKTIETYIDHLIKTGEVNNTIDAVKAKIKSVEKMIHSDPNDRKANRVALVAAHFEFLSKADEIKRNSAKFGRV